jgi:hypothetical protein
MITIILYEIILKSLKLISIGAITEKEFNKRKAFKINYWTYY